MSGPVQSYLPHGTVSHALRRSQRAYLHTSRAARAVPVDFISPACSAGAGRADCAVFHGIIQCVVTFANGPLTSVPIVTSNSALEKRGQHRYIVNQRYHEKDSFSNAHISGLGGRKSFKFFFCRVEVAFRHIRYVICSGS